MSLISKVSHLPPKSLVLSCLAVGVLLLPPLVQANTDDPAHWAEARKQLARTGKGFLVWESRREGPFAIWRMELDGSNLRRISPEEDREHYSPHISPDGRHVVFQSYPKGWHKYDRLHEAKAPLWIMQADGKNPKVLVEDSRMYGEDRAVVWLNNEELLFIDPYRMTWRLNIRTGAQEEMLHERASGGNDSMELGYLIDPNLRFATRGRPSFSLYDKDARRVDRRSNKGGCQPYFTRNGEWGFWVFGAGGPVRAIHLLTGKESDILTRGDKRLPGNRNYIYFPMVSPCGRLIAFSASSGKSQHDHFRGDYDVFVAPIDIRTMQLTGDPVRYTFEKSTDRFPDVFAEGAPPLIPGEFVATQPASDAESWPEDHDGMLFAWEAGDRPNLVREPGTSNEITFPVEARGMARLDHRFAMRPAGGSFLAAHAGPHLLAGFQATNAITIEAVIHPEKADQKGPARIVSFSHNSSQRNFTLGQEGNALAFRLRTPLTNPNGNNPELNLLELSTNEPQHVVVTYSPGNLVAYKNGVEVFSTGQILGDFSNWTEQTLIFGDEVDGRRTWLGRLEGVALFNRAIPAKEVAGRHQQWQKRFDASKQPEQIKVTARLIENSKIPTLQEIQPYKEALAVFEYQIEEAPRGRKLPETVRVAQWVMLDGKPTPAAKAARNRPTTLQLERFEENPQLESHFLSDTLEENFEAELFFEAGE